MWPAYIDPNAGYQIFSSVGPFIGFLLAVLGVLFWPVLKLGQGFRHFHKKSPRLSLFILLLLVIIGGFSVYAWVSGRHAPVDNRVIVVGMDGLDPQIAERMMASGDLPNFKKLNEMGDYKRLATVFPPQSPVAWSTFATGLNPGRHGIHDFLWRHRENYMPDLSLTQLEPAKVLKVFGKAIPLGKSKFVTRRKGIPFWTQASEAGIPTTVIHCPMTFPPEKVSRGMLSGMGVPDLRGTQGTFSLYSDKHSSKAEQGGLRIPVDISEQNISTVLKGPWLDKTRDAEVPLAIEIEPEQDAVRLRLQGSEFKLDLRKWSHWVRVKFDTPSGKVEGMTRFYLKSIQPSFELYASAFHFTPEKPVHAISYPHRYAARLQEAVGDFHTLGMPHDTWALNAGAMDEDMFLDQSSRILEEETAMLKHELPQFDRGLFVFVLVTLDRIQHMFWRAIDEESPLYSQELQMKYGQVIEEYYRKMDDILGLILGYVDERTTLMVISDHGFKSFRRAVHINSWLREEGYLNYAQPVSDGPPFFQGVDWSRSKAYAVGLGGIYLNLKGREGKGIVHAGEEAARIKTEIAEKLGQLKDQENQRAVVSAVYRGEEVFESGNEADAPDLLIGFAEGYRASWQTALGAAPPVLIEDNMKKWSGDHINDAPLVPGVLFSNRPIIKEKPSLYDLSPTILSLLGLGETTAADSILFDKVLPASQNGDK